MIKGVRWVVGLSWCGVLACGSDARNEPSLKEKCTALQRECRGIPDMELARCYKIGDDGANQTGDAARCFTAYDQCIHDCTSYQRLLQDSLGADAGRQ